MTSAKVGLIGDIGGTNARFAMVDPAGNIGRIRTLATADYANITDAIAAYIAAEPSIVPADAVLAVAAPVIGDQIVLTNSPWAFSSEELRIRFALERLTVVNDFTAVALAVPCLKEGDCVQVGPGQKTAEAPIGIIGPGTGLGVSGLVPTAEGWTTVPGEGGHVTMPAGDARESAVLDLMRRRFDHVSAERVLSGPGLVNLYNVLCELAGAPAASYTAAQITDPQIGSAEPRCREAVMMFCAMLGTIAGDLALTLGARGGVYIAGGIVQKLGPIFARSAFRERFEAKGRLRHYLATIPTFVITHPVPAFLGAAKLLERA